MVSGNVYQARAKSFGNPDLDNEFFDFYERVCNKLKKIFKTERATTLVMSGEGMLGLDAACASLIEKGDRVLVLSNGIFGEGFKDLAEIYGAEVTVFQNDWKKPILAKDLEEFLDKDSNYKIATLVHCDTPSGILNDIEPLCKILKDKNIMTIVDTVAALGGTEFEFDKWNIDVALAASQKVFSAPPGLSILCLSEKAWETIENRKSKIPSYYCNLNYWKNCIKNKYFPYTMPASDIMGLNTALENLLGERLERVIERHKEIQEYTIERLEEMGLKLYLETGNSPTVTAFLVPENYEADEVIEYMKENFKVMISSSYGILKGKILRIGHMGENARMDRVMYTLDSLEKTLVELKKI